MTPKREPSADIRQAAVMMHSVFTALIDEGFTESQALTILGTMLAASISNNKPGDQT